jgi:hypothetical protein
MKPLSSLRVSRGTRRFPTAAYCSVRQRYRRTAPKTSPSTWAATTFAWNPIARLKMFSRPGSDAERRQRVDPKSDTDPAEHCRPPSVRLVRTGGADSPAEPPSPGRWDSPNLHREAQTSPRMAGTSFSTWLWQRRSRCLLRKFWRRGHSDLNGAHILLD